MHGPINGISPNNISKWQMEFSSAFKGLMHSEISSGAILENAFELVPVKNYRLSL
jgi:hypothetical protein